MKARLIIITLFLLALPISTFAQWRPDDDDFIMPDSIAQLYDSLDAVELRLKSISGLTGTVAAGVVACADSTGALSIASFDDPYLNRKFWGFGTGIAGIMYTSGIVDATGATKIGITYWLDVTGTIKDAPPDSTNVWRLPLGRCVATDKLEIIRGQIGRRH